MTDISGYGLEVLVVASDTLPVGFVVTEFADDADALTVEDLQMGDSAMGLNGDLVTWSTPNPIQVTMNVIPDSDDDTELAILASANRVGKGKRAVLDEISMTVSRPGRPPLILTKGKMVMSKPFSGVQQGGRKQTKPYSFVFENVVGL